MPSDPPRPRGVDVHNHVVPNDVIAISRSGAWPIRGDHDRSRAIRKNDVSGLGDDAILNPGIRYINAGTGDRDGEDEALIPPNSGSPIYRLYPRNACIVSGEGN